MPFGRYLPVNFGTRTRSGIPLKFCVLDVWDPQMTEKLTAFNHNAPKTGNRPSSRAQKLHLAKMRPGGSKGNWICKILACVWNILRSMRRTPGWEGSFRMKKSERTLQITGAWIWTNRSRTVLIQAPERKKIRKHGSKGGGWRPFFGRTHGSRHGGWFFRLGGG